MTLLVRGIDWSNPTAPRIRCVDDTTSATTFFTHDSVLRFSVDETKGRRCLGWRDLTAEGPGHSPCDRGATVTAGRQCDRCRNREGFTTVHQAHVSGTHIHPNVRTYLAQPQWLYVDVFAGGQMKVGTASEFRKHPRVAEQGAVCALFVARSTDGYSIRALEARVSEHFHLSQAIRTSRKIEALTGPLDREKLRKSLHHFVSSIKDELNDIGSDIDGIEILEAPEEWTAPACADMVFDAAPLIAYPHTFESGEHSLYLGALPVRSPRCGSTPTLNRHALSRTCPDWSVEPSPSASSSPLAWRFRNRCSESRSATSRGRCGESASDLGLLVGRQARPFGISLDGGQHVVCQ